jgi:hypothetical protein
MTRQRPGKLVGARVLDRLRDLRVRADASIRDERAFQAAAFGESFPKDWNDGKVVRLAVVERPVMALARGLAVLATNSRRSGHVSPTQEVTAPENSAGSIRFRQGITAQGGHSFLFRVLGPAAARLRRIE